MREQVMNSIQDRGILLATDQVDEQERMIEELKARGIVSLVVDFAGSSDEGNIDGIHFLNEHGEGVIFEDDHGDFDAECEEFAGMILSDVYGNGWMDGNGLKGNLTLSAETGIIEFSVAEPGLRKDYEEVRRFPIMDVFKAEDGRQPDQASLESVRDLVATLVALGITRVETDYEGDNGGSSIEPSFVAYSGENVVPLDSPELAQDVVNFVNTYTEIHDSDFTFSDNGAGGEITMDLVDGIVTVHKWSYVESEEEASFTLPPPSAYPGKQATACRPMD